MKKLEVGIVVPFNMLSTVFVSFLASLFFKEIILVENILGIILIFAGLILLTRINKKQENSSNLRKNFKSLSLLIFASLLFSINIIIDKYGISNNYFRNENLMFWFTLFLVINFGVFYILTNNKVNYRIFIKNYWLILGGLTLMLANYTYYKSLEYNNSSISFITIIRQLATFISVVLGSVFLKEKKLLAKLFILLVMFLGILLISIY